MYAGRKRKKPVPKSPRPPPAEGGKSNPSKRHRERLNQELSALTGLLPFPEDVRSRLDKLSILRLAVGYLKVKSYLMATAPEAGSCVERHGAPGGWTEPQGDSELLPEGELLLQALNGFVIAVTGDGYIFYISPTVQDYLGFHQSDLIYQSVYELIHADDRAAFRRQLHRPPLRAADAFPAEHPRVETQPFVERSFTCRFRCLLDNSSGFLALNFRGRLKLLLGQQKSAADKSPVALFAIATLLQPLSILELRTKTLIFQTKHKLDFTPTACDSRGKVVLGYTEVELCRRGSGYQFVHAADMMHCAEHHVRMMRTGESGLTVFRLLTKRAGWVWVQANARLVYKGDRPDCIIARQRALSNEEGEEHLRKRNLQLPFSFATGEAVLYGNDLPGFLDSFQAKEELQVQAEPSSEQRSVDPNSLLGAMMRQDASIYSCPADSGPQLSLPAFPDGPSQPEHLSSTEDGDSLLVVIEALFEQGEAAAGVRQSAGSAELQPWERALLGSGAQEEPPAQRLGSGVASCVGQAAGESLELPACRQESGAAFQRCWAAGWAGRGAVGSVGSSAQPRQQVPLEPAAPSAAAAGTAPAPLQPGGSQLLGSGCPPALRSGPSVTLWRRVPLQASPAGCPAETWLAPAPKHLEAAGALTESQTLPAGSPESPPGAGLWLPPPSHSIPCPPQGLHESLFSGDGNLCGVEAALPALLGAGRLPGHSGFPTKEEPGCSWAGEQAGPREDGWLSQLWLPQAGAAPPRSHGAGPAQPGGLLLGPGTHRGAHPMDCTLLPQCQPGNSLFRPESSFPRDATQVALGQQQGAAPHPAENHPGAPCSSPSSAPGCPAALPVKVVAGAPPCSGQGPGCPSGPFSAGQPLCACEIQLKVRCEGCRT